MRCLGRFAADDVELIRTHSIWMMPEGQVAPKHNVRSHIVTLSDPAGPWLESRLQQQIQRPTDHKIPIETSRQAFALIDVNARRN